VFAAPPQTRPLRSARRHPRLVDGAGSTASRPCHSVSPASPRQALRLRRHPSTKRTPGLSAPSGLASAISFSKTTYAEHQPPRRRAIKKGLPAVLVPTGRSGRAPRARSRPGTPAGYDREDYPSCGRASARMPDSPSAATLRLEGPTSPYGRLPPTLTINPQHGCDMGNQPAVLQRDKFNTSSTGEGPDTWARDHAGRWRMILRRPPPFYGALHRDSTH